MAKTDPKKLADALKKIALFNGLSPTQLRVTLGHCHAQQFEAGTVVCQQGGASDEMHILVSGKLAVLEDNVRVASIIPVDSVGEMGVITGHARSATVEAVEPSHVLTIEKVKLDSVLRAQRDLKNRIFANIINILSEKLVRDNVRMRDFLSTRTRFESSSERMKRELDAAVQLLGERGLEEEEARKLIEDKADSDTPMVLIVAAEPEGRELLSRGLCRYRVVEAEHGEEALEVLKTQQAKVVLSDIHLPKMDGLALLKQLRADYPKLPVVAVSAYGDTVDLSDSDFNAILEKPVALDEVRKVVDDLATG
ncbi:MAG: response regulator [Candidatus Latescibacterota bacterium]|nr:response regulator [Candidatus Latescibacterota bacterium]